MSCRVKERDVALVIGQYEAFASMFNINGIDLTECVFEVTHFLEAIIASWFDLQT